MHENAWHEVNQALELLRSRLARLHDAELDQARATAQNAERILAEGSKTTKQVEPLDSVVTIAEFLGMKRSWVYAQTAAKTGMPFFKLGNYIRFRRSEVTAWLEKQRSSPNGRPDATVAPRRNSP